MLVRVPLSTWGLGGAFEAGPQAPQACGRRLQLRIRVASCISSRDYHVTTLDLGGKTPARVGARLATCLRHRADITWVVVADITCLCHCSVVARTDSFLADALPLESSPCSSVREGAMCPLTARRQV